MLRAEGHQVVGVTRRKGSIARRLPADGWVALDMARAVTPDAWRPHLQGIEAVVDCGVALEVAGPERLSCEEVVDTYRRWLGFRAARPLPGGALLMPLAWRLGDLAGLLGWRPPIRTNARREMVRGAVGDNTEWRRLTGI